MKPLDSDANYSFDSIDDSDDNGDYLNAFAAGLANSDELATDMDIEYPRICVDINTEGVEIVERKRDAIKMPPSSYPHLHNCKCHHTSPPSRNAFYDYNNGSTSVDRDKHTSPLEISALDVKTIMEQLPNGFKSMNSPLLNRIVASIDMLYATFYMIFEHSNPQLPEPSKAIQLGYIRALFDHFEPESYACISNAVDIMFIMRAFCLADFAHGLVRTTARSSKTYNLMLYVTYFEPTAKKEFLSDVQFHERDGGQELVQFRTLFYLLCRRAWIDTIFSRVQPNISLDVCFTSWLLSPESPLSLADICGNFGIPLAWRIPAISDDDVLEAVEIERETLERLIDLAARIDFDESPSTLTVLHEIEACYSAIKQCCNQDVYTPSVMTWAQNIVKCVEDVLDVGHLERLFVSAPFTGMKSHYVGRRYDRKLFKIVLGAILRRFDAFAGMDILYGSISDE